MDGEETKRGTGIPLNLTTILALLTLAGSVLLVSHQLASDRPQAWAGNTQETIADQTIEARLWEDPFSVWDKLSPRAIEQLSSNSLSALVGQIKQRTDGNEAPWLIPVMLDGGAYSENRESRVRSRFAVIAALGQEGYDPEESEHIGALLVPWLSSAELKEQKDKLRLDLLTSSQRLCRDNRHLQTAYEWYQQRDPFPHSEAHPKRRLLVLWLNEDQFDDEPLLRLAMLLHPLIEGNSPSIGGMLTNINLIGPRRSSTLRSMVSDGMCDESVSGQNSALSRQVKDVLHRVSIFMAVPAAMDEVLVKTEGRLGPREAVLNKLKPIFKSACNFCATEDQLAEQILGELKLRRVDLSDPAQHLVLVSESDTFYGRMLSLTYAAELACSAGCSNRADFIRKYREGAKEILPKNLHSFVYLLGMDGQTVQGHASGSDARTSPSSLEISSRSGGPLQSRQTRSPSITELGRWTPDANKAEGSAQFDYLSRIGDSVQSLQRDLTRSGAGTIKAIGILGSDMYDTLLILQALRPRFPNALFFTTDLDARLWHPSEWNWTRNLIVASGYGLQLHPDLQRSAAPFRDSRQTAQFAAALAALGNTQLPNLASISPRRFEIGRLGPVNLSTNISPLHPVPPNQIQVWSYDKRAALTSFGLVLAIATLATLLGRPWRHLTVERKQYQAEGLWLKEEDIGGCEGFARILAAVSTGGQSADPLAEWIREEFGRELSGSSSSNFPSKPLDPHSGKLPPRSSGEILMQDFLDFVNRRLRQDRWIPSHILEATKLITPKRKDVYRRMQTESNERQPYFDRTNLKVLSEKRFIVDEVLNKLLGSKGYHLSSTNEDEAFKVEDAASCARRAGREKYQLRLRRQATLLTLLGIFAPLGLVLAYCCWHDTKPFSLGEPFSLTSGASVWPTEWLRLVGVFLALVFAAESFFRVRHGVLDITRNYRLSLSNDLGSTGYVLETTPVPQAFISANRAWERYQKMGRWWNRCRRLLLPLLVYLVFGFMLMSLGPWPVAPLRGRLSFLWDKSLLWGAILVFLFLTFWTIDATRLCRWFIQYLSEAPTRYPQATLSHFKGLKGLAVGEDILVEWLDLRLIAELTDYVGKLIYFPFVIFFILLLSRHHWWDNWPWTWPLAAIFIVNLLLVVTSAVILQQAAQRARELGLTNLETKLDRMKGEGAQTEEEKARHSVSQAQDLLEDIRQLRKGAFTSFWENPILGALLLPSGGTALIELCSYFLQR